MCPSNNQKSKNCRNPVIWFFIFIYTLSACTKAVENTQVNIHIDMEDAVVQRILEFGNERLAKSIIPFLAVDNPNHRYAAVWALTSLQDTNNIEGLANAIYDEQADIRAAAAYALGQTKHRKAAKILVEAFAQDTSRKVQASILEAVGRCGTEEELKYLTTVPPYPIKETLLLKGHVLGLYRFMLRGMYYEESVDKIINDFIANSLMPSSVRMIAASYLTRVKKIDLAPYEEVLITNVKEEKEEKVLLFLVLGLAKTKMPKALQTLKKVYHQTEDDRIRCNIIRGLNNFPYDSVRTLALTALKDTSYLVRLEVANYFYAFGNDKDALLYNNLSKEQESWEIAIRLQASALRNYAYYRLQSKAYISQKLISRYKNSTNLYEKASIVDALGEFSRNYRFLKTTFFPVEDSIVIPEVLQTSAIQALINIRKNPQLPRDYGLSTMSVLDDLHLLFREGLGSGNPGKMASLAEFFLDTDIDFSMIYQDFQFLLVGKSKLKMPNDIETISLMQKVINKYMNKEDPIPSISRADFAKIDWRLLNVLNKNPIVNFKTQRGTFSIRLFPALAPATVVQFVQLVQSGFYTNKTFHRVEPNFVLQGGCSRGDGWGGFERMVVSEYGSPTYYDEAGWVGMASAGKDTEATQFFITHLPTPHLDGRYTIFAKVEEGLDQISQIQKGDTIQTVALAP